MVNLRFCGARALLALLFVSRLETTESSQIKVVPKKGTDVTISSKLPDCTVCTVSGVNDSQTSCHPSLNLKPEETVKLLFNCSKPAKDSYSVTIHSLIVCTMSSCTPAVAEVDPEFFRGFQKTLTWDISGPKNSVLTLDFPNGGLKEISESQNCGDGFKYTVSTTRTDRQVKTSIYCKSGKVSTLELPVATTVTVEVQKEGELDQTVFRVETAPKRGRTIFVSAEPGTTVIIKTESKESDCGICATKGPDTICNEQTRRLKNPNNISVEFACSQPQKTFTLEMNREIVCTETSCLGNTVHADNIPLADFNRSFTWDLKVVTSRVFQLDFGETGLRQIPNEDTCPDNHTYSVIIYLRTGPAKIGTFCKGGPVTSIQARHKSRVTLTVPGDERLDPVDFKVTVGPETKMVAIVNVRLPRGESDTDFITANYPVDFPDHQQMQWEFTIPDMHNYTVQFRDHSAPECLNGDVVVEYHKENKKVTILSLTDPQPRQQQGNFKFVLKNCETNTTLSGLSLSYRVSVMRSGHPVLCTVDLTTHQMVSMQLEKVGSDPSCEMRINSELKEKIHVANGTKAELSFLDCLDDDIHLNGSQVIACQNVLSCPPISLSVPTLDSCVLNLLQNFTWHLTIPHEATLDLVSPSGSLLQSLSREDCQNSSPLQVAEADGFFIGNFCSGGVIKMLQVHANVSVTAKQKDLRSQSHGLLNVSFSPEISETIIYRTSPDMSSPVMLATPGWPRGMNPFSTVSWIVDVPSHYVADIQFFNLSQPKCDDGHTYIKVKLLGEEEELMSRSEQEKVENLTVGRSFYLNMSNCKPDIGEFSAMTDIVLRKKSYLLPILLGLLGALVVMVIVLVVICVVLKKKKESNGTSYYETKSNIFRPNDTTFIKTNSQSDSHIYDYIDDTMVYGHLLGDSVYSDDTGRPKGIQTDSYQTFTGPTDGPLPVINEPEPQNGEYRDLVNQSETFIPSRPRTPINRQDSLGFQDRRMVDNELYTFKSMGNMNVIRLSSADQEPQPPELEESL